MADESVYQTEQSQLPSNFWEQYYSMPQNTPTGFQFNQNQAMANALRGYGEQPYLEPVTYMPGYENTLTRKLLEKKDSGLTTTQSHQQSGMQMPNMNMMRNMPVGNANSFGVDTSLPATSGSTQFTDGNAPFGSTGGADVTGNSFVGSQMDSPDFTPSAGGMFDGGGTQWFGNGGQLGGGWASAAGGALNGYMAGRQNYQNDPNMWNGKDGYGKYHKDYRAEVGGGTLGGVMGYWGGPVGAALAGPAVKFVHPYAEKGTRAVINAGDKVGGSGGALMVDPIGTVSSGKYSWGDLGKGALLGPAKKWFGW